MVSEKETMQGTALITSQREVPIKSWFLKKDYQKRLSVKFVFRLKMPKPIQISSLLKSWED